MAELTIESLKDNISNMAALSDEALTNIRAIARLALYALETPSGVRDLATLADALQLIADFACVASNNIGCEADESGSDCLTDEARNRRWAAQHKCRLESDSLAVASALAGRA
jgi:hypothetical protein